MTLLHRLIPPLGKRKALRIAQKHCQPDLDQFRHQVDSDLPLELYGKPTEPHWTVYAPWMDGHDGAMIRSSRVILVSKRTGKILYDGSASDEG